MQNFGTARDVLIRLPVKQGVTSAKLSEQVMQELRQLDAAVELRRVEFVGPQVGRELLENGALALLFVSIGIVLYLWFRFEWKFGVSAIIANLHDVVIILGFFSIFPVGVLAAGAGRGAGDPRLLGERVGGGVRPGAREFPQPTLPRACRAADHRQRDHRAPCRAPSSPTAAPS